MTKKTVEVPSKTVLADRYELGELLGAGGMSRVHRAHDRLLDRTVAIKLLRHDAEEAHAARVRAEAVTASQIDDPRVVRILDLGDSDVGPFLVMQAVQGPTLDDLLASGPLAPARWWRLARDLLGGLAAAHRSGIVHRDVKPSNVLVDGDGFCITDFGVSHRSDEHDVPMGTPAYAAPECLAGGQATTRSDVFSAALVLRDALVSPTERDRGPTSVVPRDNPLPARAADAMAAALATDPAARPADAARFLQQLGDQNDEGTTRLLDDVRDPTIPLDGTRSLAPPADDDPTHRTTDAQTSTPVPRSTRDGRVERIAAIVAALGVVLLLFALFGPRSSPATSGREPSSDRAELSRTLDEIEELGR